MAEDDASGERQERSRAGNGSSGLIDAKTKQRVLWVVVAVWATNFFAGVATSEYNPDPQIHAVFMIVAGAIFATDVHSRKGGS